MHIKKNKVINTVSFPKMKHKKKTISRQESHEKRLLNSVVYCLQKHCVLHVFELWTLILTHCCTTLDPNKL